MEGVWTSIGVLLQMLLASLIIYKLTKSVSNIVQGLMSGAPSLGGSMMTSNSEVIFFEVLEAHYFASIFYPSYQIELLSGQSHKEHYYNY